MAIFDFIDKYSVDNKISIYNLCKIFGVYERTFYKHKKKVTKQSNLYVILSKMYEVLDDKESLRRYRV